MRRLLAVWLPFWPTDRLPAGGEPALPLALTRAGQGGIRLHAVDRRAAALGLQAGMTAADARALVPELRTLPADPAGDAAALQRLVRWCGRYSPWVAADGPDGICLDITGCGHLFGGEAALARDLADRLRARGLAVRLALADSAAAAWALARFAVAPEAAPPSPAGAGAGWEGEALIVAPPGEQERPLRPLPLAALRLEPGRLAALERVGLRRIGDLAGLPRGSLARRFGADLLQRLDAVLAREEAPLSPAMPVPDWQVRLTFPEPVGLRADLDAGCLRLLQALCARLERDGRGARRLELTLFRADGESQCLRIGTARPVRDPGHLMRLFAERLGEAQPGFGIDVMILSAPVTEPLQPEQLRVEAAAERRQLPGRPGGEGLPALLDRLAVRLGAERVQRLAAVDAHLPEDAQRLLPAQEAGATERAAVPPVPAVPRPVALLPQPEPVEAEAAGPAGAPAAFRWRRVAHRVVAAEGPERIAPPWWRSLSAAEAPPPARDYYRVEDEAGRRFWLFRPCDGSGWFLHGLFG